MLGDNARGVGDSWGMLGDNARGVGDSCGCWGIMGGVLGIIQDSEYYPKLKTYKTFKLYFK